MLSDTTIYTASAPRNSKRFAGIAASKSTGAKSRITAHMIIKWIKAEINIVISPQHSGTPFALYTFFISPAYVSTSDGGNPINAPMDTVITVMDCISVSFICGITEVKIPPISKKKISGTT